MNFYFSKSDIIHIHDKLISKFGGSFGIRDEGILDSAIGTPLQTFASKDLYPTAIEKITRLSFGLAMDHPFIDGNKRVAAAILYLGLGANKVPFQVSDEEMTEEFLLLVSGKIPYPDLLSWVYSKI